MKAALPFGLVGAVPVLPAPGRSPSAAPSAPDIQAKKPPQRGQLRQSRLSLDLLMADGERRTITPSGGRTTKTGRCSGPPSAEKRLDRHRIRADRHDRAPRRPNFIADGVATSGLDETVAVHLDGAKTGTLLRRLVDLISAPPKLGRATVSRGSLAKLDQLPSKLAKNPLQFTAPQLPRCRWSSPIAW